MSDIYAAIPAPKYSHDQVSLQITWRWSADSNEYILESKTFDESTQEVLYHTANWFKWKSLDATGDAALAVRWIRASREWLKK